MRNATQYALRRKLELGEDISIHKYEESDRIDCLNLLRTTFPSSSTEDTFKWRFESIGRKKPLIVCAKHEGRIVSFNSWIPWEFFYKDHIYIGYQSGESATHFDYRGKGIFKRVIKFADQIAQEQGIDFFFGFPNSISYGAFIKSDYYPIETYFFSVRLQSPFKKFIESAIWKPPAIDDCLVLLQQNKISPLSNNDYNEWRYMNKMNDYSVNVYAEGNSRAFFYLRRNKRKGIPELVLMDFQTSNYNEQFISRAFFHIDSVYSRSAFYMRTFFSKNSDRGSTLRRHFPIRIKTKYQTLIVKNISNKLNSLILLNSNNWDVMPHCVDWM